MAHAESGQQLAATLWQALKLVGAAALIALFVRMVVVQPFSIPSRSMAPLLDAGDFIFVDKTAYGWSRAALSFQPVDSLLPGEPIFGVDLPSFRVWGSQLRKWTGDRIGGTRPVAGDVIVFIGPARANGDQVDYVKRVIARAGDRIGLSRGRVILNGRALPCQPLEQKQGQQPGQKPGQTLCREVLPDGAGYVVLESGTGALANFAEIVVPEGQYFVLGDNRDDSADSRLSVAQGGVGLVPDTLVVGRARHIFFSLGPDGVRWDRIGQVAQ